MSGVPAASSTPQIARRSMASYNVHSRAAARIASSAIMTDWGARPLSATSPLFDPLHYNNGAVWPFVTGWVALAQYRYHNALAGRFALDAVARTTFESSERSVSIPEQHGHVEPVELGDGQIGIAVVAAGWHRPADPAGSYLVCLGTAAAALESLVEFSFTGESAAAAGATVTSTAG